MTYLDKPLTTPYNIAMTKQTEQKRGRGRPPKYNEPSARVETTIPQSLERWISENHDSKSGYIAKAVIAYSEVRGYEQSE